MVIADFIKEFKKDFTNLKTMLNIRTYIPMAEKKAIIETVLDECFRAEDGILTCDCALKNVAFELAMVKYHTDLDVDITSYDNYDELHTMLLYLHNEYFEDYDACYALFNEMERELRAKHSVEASMASISHNVRMFVRLISDTMDGFDIGKLDLKELLKESTE